MSDDDRVREALAARAAARELASEAQICAALDRLGAQITANLAGDCPVLLAMMHGGAFTATALAQRLDFPHEFDYVHLSRYGKALEGGAIEWLVKPRASLRGRHVLIVDDILDRGHSIAALKAELAAVGAARVSTAVLVAKDVAVPRPAVDYVGLRIDDCYVFGCGMDYKGYWRGLSALYAVT